MTQTQSADNYRQKFPALANKIYFNYGGQGPMTQDTIDSIIQAQAYIQEIGPFGNQVGSWINRESSTARAAIASELNVAPDTITLTENVTVGCNIAMWGIDWHVGDHLLISDCEHPGVVAIAEEIGRRFSVEVTTFPLLETLNTKDPVTAIAQHIGDDTRLLVLSHILWNTGQLLPLDEIADLCIEKNVRLLVDAAQSVGGLPINLTATKVDFYAFTGHKWLCGPGGVGGLYVRPEIRDNLAPTMIGWRGVVSGDEALKWHSDGRRYEIATSNYPLYSGLTKAIAIHQQWGTTARRYQQICGNSEYLWQHLQQLPGVECLRTSPPETGLVSFQLTDKTSSQLVNYLESQSIFTRTIAHPDCIRACVHYFTLESEIDQLVAEIKKFIDT